MKYVATCASYGFMNKYWVKGDSVDLPAGSKVPPHFKCVDKQEEAKAVEKKLEAVKEQAAKPEEKKPEPAKPVFGQKPYRPNFNKK
jgi:hypothetical protein